MLLLLPLLLLGVWMLGQTWWQRRLTGRQLATPTWQIPLPAPRPSFLLHPEEERARLLEALHRQFHDRVREELRAEVERYLSDPERLQFDQAVRSAPRNPP